MSLRGVSLHEAYLRVFSELLREAMTSISAKGGMINEVVDGVALDNS